jgi:hypothetical protein
MPPKSTPFRHSAQVVFRVCQLWFDNASQADVNEALRATLLEVPCYKFVPLVYQMASRLSRQQGNFQVGGRASCQEVFERGWLSRGGLN